MFQASNCSPLEILRRAMVKIGLGVVITDHPVFISKNLIAGMLLGNDFLANHKCDVLNSLWIVEFGGITVPMRKSKTRM